jgi:hypothetical protein
MKTVLSVVCGALFLSACRVQAAGLDVQYSQDGIASVKWGGTEVLAGGLFKVERSAVVVSEDQPPVPVDQYGEPVFDKAGKRVDIRYPWGKAVCTYRSEGNRLAMEVTFRSMTNAPLTGLAGTLMELRLPGQAKRVSGRSVDDIAALLVPFERGMLVVCCETLGDPAVELVLSEPDKDGKSRLRFNTSLFSTPADFVLKPGEEKSFVFSLRFGQAGSDLKTLAGDLYEKFAVLYPRTLKWDDHRVIAMIMVASAGEMHKSPGNPRGWLNEPKLVVTNEAGRAAFRTQMLAQADRCVKTMKAMDAQGGIVWDVEGEQYGNITFVGDPRMLPELAPEMDEVADAYFQKFRDAGLKTGVCIRPSKIVPDWEKKAVWRHRNMGFDVAAEMIDKITYAKKRWGCTLFYIDTNYAWGWTWDKKPVSWMLRAEVIRKLHEAHPDVLIIPEFQNLAYWAYGSGYKELREHAFGGYAAIPERALLAYPDAFAVLNVPEGKIDERREELVRSVARGDILMTYGWFGAKVNEKVADIYKAAAPAPVR